MTTLEILQKQIADSGLTPYAIAQRTGLSPHTVAAVIRGDGNPTLGTMELIRIAVEAASNAS
jgi:transcriptional regulator with XRE-family HTH domain